MRWISKSTRVALLAYALLAVLILGGVTWGTMATLQLERKDAEDLADREHRDKIARACYRIDSVIKHVLSREAGRSYKDYTAYAAPSEIWEADGTEVDTEAMFQPSPLLDAKLEPWIKVHFQVSPDNAWRSPQVPDFIPSFDSTLPLPDTGTVARRREALSALKTACVSFETLAARFVAANERSKRYESIAKGAEHQTIGPGSPEGVPIPKSAAIEFSKRTGSWTHAQSYHLPPQACLVDEGQSLVGVNVTPLTPVWLPCKGNPHHQLAFIRLADLEGRKHFQGLVIDWSQLKAELVAEVAYLFPSADLLPVDDTSITDIDRLMSPPFAAIEVDPPAAAGLPWTSTHLMLIVAWLAALAILGGVGVGIESLLTLTERRTQFAYAVTHELRTPLTTLRLYTDMLASGLVPEQERDRYCRTLNDEAERLANLVSGVLDYARVENRTVKLDVRRVAVASILESIRTQCAARCQDAGKKLVVDVNGLDSTTIATDPKLVGQVITNLVDNACKHTKGAKDPTITVRACALHGDRIGLDVQDQGSGIGAADKHHIFKPFRRGRNGTSHGSGGIGLGLALARSWARLLGGRLELTPGHGDRSGTCFRLTIPSGRD